MSNNCWQASLRRLLNQAASKNNPPRVAVVGVGNILRNDDAAGILAARALASRARAAHIFHLLVLEGGSAPENATGELRAFAPDVVLMIDAADMRESPGSVRWISMENIDGVSASTHSLPLSMLARYLTLELNCAVAALGIQPQSNDVGETVCTEVSRAADEVAGAICAACLV